MHVHVAWGRGLDRRGDTLCISGFMDDVIFYYGGMTLP